MARADPETRLQDRTARRRLKPQSEPYWRLLFPGAHIGYYYGTKRGSWVARVKVGRSYTKKRFGKADDDAEADGENILSWKQALDTALSWAKTQMEGPSGEVDPPASSKDQMPENDSVTVDAPETVDDAIAYYVAMRDKRASERAGRQVKSDAHRLNLHVGNHSIAVVELALLTEELLRGWLKDFVMEKRTSKQRTVSDFKAALNLRYDEDRRKLPRDFPVIVKYGLKMTAAGDDEEYQEVARENQILSDDQVRGLIEVASEIDSDGDVGRLVLVLAATGARFSQVVRMKVRDVQAAQSRLLVPPSRKGRGKAKGLIRVRVDQSVIDALAIAMTGRAPGASLLERWRHRQIGPAKWERTERGPWTSSAEITRPASDEVDEAHRGLASEDRLVDVDAFQPLMIEVGPIPPGARWRGDCA